jgi:hypothetical protein
MYTPKYKFTTEHQNCKDRVPDQILQAGKWHWDPQKTDHTDDQSFVGNIDYDWKRLEQWAIDFAKKSKYPQRWFTIDREKGIIYHGNDIVNGMPYYEQAKQLVETNGFNEHNTQYYKAKDQDLNEHFEPLWNMVNLDDKNMSVFVQMPGHAIPSHADVYSSFIRQDKTAFVDGKLQIDHWTDANAWNEVERMRRYTVFVNDWDWGQFYHQGNHVMQPWRGGDMWQIPTAMNHGSANAGINPKVTFHWSGKTIPGKAVADQIRFRSQGVLFDDFSKVQP